MTRVFLRHPSRIQPVPRLQSNNMTTVVFSPSTNINFERTSFSTTLAPISPLKGCDSVTSCPDVVEVPERFEQIQLAQSSDNVLPPVPRRSEPEILTRPDPWISLSASEGQRATQPQHAQFPILHARPYQEQHMPVYEPQLTTVPTVSSAPEVSMDYPQPLLDSMTFQQQQLSEAMDIDLDCPQSLMHRPRQYSTTEAAPPACPQFYPLQNQFTNASQPQFINDGSGFSSSGRSFSYGSPMLQSTWAPNSRGEPSLPSPSIGPCAPEWTSSYPWHATMAHASRPVIQPLHDISAIETFDFNVHPETATPDFGFSQQLAPANPTRSSHAESISARDMSLDESHELSQPVSTDHMQPINQNSHQPQTLSVSSSNHQPDVVPRSSSVDTVKAKGEMATQVSVGSN